MVFTKLKSITILTNESASHSHAVVERLVNESIKHLKKGGKLR